MATIRERTKRDGTRVFQVQVRMAGFPARTASFRTKRNAERWAKTVEAEMIEGKHFRSVEARRRTVGEAIDRYIKDVLPGKGDQKPAIRLRWWKAEIGIVKLADVTPALLVERRDKLVSSTYQRAKPESSRSMMKKKGGACREYKRTPATVNRYLANLGHVFTVARREWHWIAHNPMDGVSKLKEGSGRVRYLSDEERKVLLTETAKDPVLHTFTVLALSTACRAGELLNLTWDDVDLKQGRVLFRKTKNAQPRVVWIFEEALQLLKEHGKVRELSGAVFVNTGGRRRARGKSRYDYDTPFRAAVAAAGINNFRFHDLRHSAATYLALQGATEQQLRAIGGWKSGIVSRYVHLAAEDAKAALQKLAKRIGP